MKFLKLLLVAIKAIPLATVHALPSSETPSSSCSSILGEPTLLPDELYEAATYEEALAYEIALIQGNVKSEDDSSEGGDEEGEGVDDIPEWKKDYYAALDTLDDDLKRRGVSVNMMLQEPVADVIHLVKRKGGGAARGSAGDKGDTGVKETKRRTRNKGTKGRRGTTNHEGTDVSNIFRRKGGGAGSAGGKPPPYSPPPSSPPPRSPPPPPPPPPPPSSPKSGTSGGGGSVSSGRGSSGGSTPASPPAVAGGKEPYTAGSPSPGGLSPVKMGFIAGGAALAGSLVGSAAGTAVGNLISYPWKEPMTYHHPPDAAPLAIPYQTVAADGGAVNNTDASNSTESSDAGTTTKGKKGDDGVYTIPPGSSVTLPVACVCGEKARCACEEVHDEEYAEQVLESAAKSGGDMQDKATLRVINDTMTLVVNGSVPDTSAAVGRREQIDMWQLLGVVVAVGGAAVVGLV